jgi:tetratricopeptide (TPR) repeat protein
LAKFSDRVKAFAESFDVESVILRYDVDFDVPLRHEYAVGILRMIHAFVAEPDADLRRTARRVGAHWCDIVRADVEYDLWSGLQLIEASRHDAERLRDAGTQEQGGAGRFIAYVSARWFDGAGKIRYRLGSYTRARIDFETAVTIAEDHGLWWCLPDLRSNLLRGRFEEDKQSATGDRKALIAALRAERIRLLDEAHAHRIAIGKVDAGSGRRAREYLRGYSSVLHNLAVALKEVKRTSESLAVSRESLRVSQALGDLYRIGQSTNHQAQVDSSRSRELFEQLAEGEWRRGRRIARQQLSRFHGVKGIDEIKALLTELHAEGEASGAGMDVDVYAYTVRLYADRVAEAKDAAQLTGEDYTRLIEDVGDKRMAMARSVRRAVALPAYKRAYAESVRPSYRDAIAKLVQAVDDTPRVKGSTEVEDAFGLAEESAARELLDMLSAADLPLLALPISTERTEPRTIPPPSVPGEETGRRGAAPDPEAVTVRRAVVRRADAQTESALVGELARRETEFEAQFLRRPLEAAPHDPEIAHRVSMYAVNNRDTCVVRYFTYGNDGEQMLGAFVFQGSDIKFHGGIPYTEVRRLADGLPIHAAPEPGQCAAIWDLLVGPIWRLVKDPEDLGHLVVIPTDDLFRIPLHVATEPDRSEPLAVRVPMSQSVSATAFVGRGRHLLKRQPVDDTDDLAAIVVADQAALDGGPGVGGQELLATNWPPDRMVVVGDLPEQIGQVKAHHPADLGGIRAITDVRPEFFIYSGHGGFNPAFPQLGPYLELHGNYLTQYDIALRLRLPRNKLTVLGACLAGQGVQTDGGDVVGFLRSLIAAGAGALAVPLWSVADYYMVSTVRTLLAESRRIATGAGDRDFDVVTALHAHYVEESKYETPLRPAERFPISLYL